MKPFFSSRISKLGSFITFCVLSTTTFSTSAIADPIRDLQDEVAKRGISSESVNTAMRARFPSSAFPYHASVNGCSTPGDLAPLTLITNRVFEGACDNHDICYASPSRSRFTCDVLFREELFKLCEIISDPDCRLTAKVYYDKVREHGQKFYDSAQDKQSEYIKSVYAWLSTLERIIVFNTNRFVDTGVLVRSGDRIRIRTNGTIRFGLVAGAGGPNGIIFNPVYNYFADVPHGRLMARFRQPGMQALDGWYPIGEGWDQVREVKLPSPGTLEFLVNDNQPGDNRGKFRIEVTIHSGKQ